MDLVASFSSCAITSGDQLRRKWFRMVCFNLAFSLVLRPHRARLYLASAWANLA